MNVVKEYWNSWKGKKTYVICAATIVYAVLGMYLHELTPQIGATYIYTALLGVGFRSALATIAEKIAMHIAEILADQLTGSQQATNDAVKAMVHDVLTQALQSLETPSVTQQTNTTI